MSSGASITANNGMVVLQGPNIAMNGAITATGGVGYIVADGGYVDFAAASGNLNYQQIGSVWSSGSPGTISFSHGGVTTGGWIDLNTQWDVDTGFDAVINISGVMEATGVKPGGSNDSVTLNFGSSAEAPDSGTITLSVSGAINAPGDVNFNGQSLGIGGSIDAGGDVSAFLWGSGTIPGAIDAGGETTIHVHGGNNVLMVDGAINSVGDISLAAMGANSSVNMNGTVSTAGNLSITAARNIGIGGSSVLTANSDNTGTGLLWINSGNGYDVATDTPFEGAGDINVDAGAQLIAGQGGNVDLTAVNGAIDMSGHITAGGAQVQLWSSGTGADLSINGFIESDGWVFARSEGNLHLGEDAGIFAHNELGSFDWPIQLSAGWDGNTGDIVIDAGADLFAGLDANTDDILIEANGSIFSAGYIDGFNISIHGSDGVDISGALSADGDLEIAAIGINGVAGGGSLVIDDPISADGDIRLFTSSGDITIAAETGVYAGLGGGGDSQIEIRTQTGDISFDGYMGGDAVLFSTGSGGSIYLDGFIDASGNVLVYSAANEAVIDVTGNIDSGGMVRISTMGEDAAVNVTGAIHATTGIGVQTHRSGSTTYVNGVLSSAGYVLVNGYDSTTLGYGAVIESDTDANGTGNVLIVAGRGYDLDADCWCVIGSGDVIIDSGAMITGGGSFGVSIWAYDGFVYMGGTITSDVNAQVWTIGDLADDVTVAGDITADGSVYVFSTGDGARTDLSGYIQAGGDVEIFANGAGGVTGIYGDIVADGSIRIAAMGDVFIGNDDNAVDIYADDNGDASGTSLMINAGLGYDFDAQTWSVEGAGSVTITGPGINLAPNALYSGTYLHGGLGRTEISARNGDVLIDGEVLSGAGITIETLGANGGDITVSAILASYGDIRLQTTEGDIDVLAGSLIGSDLDDNGAADLSLVIRAGYMVGGSGSVTIEDGAVLAAGGEASPDRISIQASNAIDMAGTLAGSRISLLADGNIDVSGEIYGTDLVQIVSQDMTFAENDVDLVGNVTISGMVVANDLVNLTSDSGNVTVTNGAVVQSDYDGVATAAVGGEETRDAVYVSAVNGAVTFEAGSTVYAGPIEATTEGLFIYAGTVDITDSSFGFVDLFMDVASDIYFDASTVMEVDSITLQTSNGGDIIFAGQMDATDVVFTTTEGGSISVSGSITAGNDVFLDSVGNVTPGATIDVSGSIFAYGDIFIGTSDAAGAADLVDISGSLQAYEQIHIRSGGDVYIASEALVALDAEGGGLISIQSGATTGAASQLVIADGALVNAGSYSDVQIEGAGGVTIDGQVTGGDITVVGHGDVGVGGSVNGRGVVEVTAAGEGSLVSSLTVDGSITAGESLALTSENGDLDINGHVRSNVGGGLGPDGDGIVIRAENGVFRLAAGATLDGGGGEGSALTDVSIYAGSAELLGSLGFQDLIVQTADELYVGGDSALVGGVIQLTTTEGGDITVMGAVDGSQVGFNANAGGSIVLAGDVTSDSSIVVNSIGNAPDSGAVIQIAGQLTAAGDVLVGPQDPTATGGADIAVSGDITAGGTLRLATSGDIAVGAESVLTANADSDGGGVLALSAGGDIGVADGALLLGGFETGAVFVQINAGGSVEMGGDASGLGIAIHAGGDIDISGDLLAQSFIQIASHPALQGDPTFISISGDIVANDAVIVRNDNGSIAVAEGALIQADADGEPTESGVPQLTEDFLVLQAINGSITTGEGSLLLAGQEELPTGLVFLYASGMDGEGAAIQLSGDIIADVVSVESYEGSIVVSGDIWATEGIQMVAYQNFVLTSDGSMRVEDAAGDPTDGSANAVPADGFSWPYADLTDVEISIAAADMEIDGQVSAYSIAILATGVDGDAILGGQDGELGGDFNLSNEEFQNLDANTVMVIAGSDGQETMLQGQTNLIVNDLDIDSDKVKTLVLGTGSESYLHVAGAVTVSDPFTTNLWIGGVAVSDGDFTTRSFIPGTVVITGSLGSIDNPFQNVSILALGDVLMGSEAFVLAAAEDPDFDAAEESSNYEIDEGHIFVAGYSLRIGANGRIIQQNTGAPGEYAGIWARAPYEGHELIWAPEELEGLEIGGEGGFTLSFNEGPEDVQLFGVFLRENDQGQLEEVSGPDAAQLEHLVDGDIELAEGFDLNTCEIGGGVCGGPETEEPEIPRFENPTELSVQELEEEEARDASDSVAGSTRSDRRDIFRTLIAPESDRAYEQERMGEPVTGSGNEDLWTGRDAGVEP
ncbi:MAG TPA: hypothetical protein VEA15_10170 [Caulobacteraceae bacterium]|nr:hypothetical protein [Caulobacteraceae bacterium]